MKIEARPICWIIEQNGKQCRCPPINPWYNMPACVVTGLEVAYKSVDGSWNYYTIKYNRVVNRGDTFQAVDWPPTLVFTE